MSLYIFFSFFSVYIIKQFCEKVKFFWLSYSPFDNPISNKGVMLWQPRWDSNPGLRPQKAPGFRDRCVDRYTTGLYLGLCSPNNIRQCYPLTVFYYRKLKRDTDRFCHFYYFIRVIHITSMSAYYEVFVGNGPIITIIYCVIIANLTRGSVV